MDDEKRRQALRDSLLFNLTVHVRANRDLLLSMIDAPDELKQANWKALMKKHSEILEQEMKGFNDSTPL